MDKLILGPLAPNLRLTETRLPLATQKEQAGGGFGSILKDAISTVNELQQKSDGEIQKIMTGESQDLHSTVIAMQKADMSFQMMMQVRNKLMQAYQEVMRMQI
jgi:flagellar hook-basal body complex protein FliE